MRANLQQYKTRCVSGLPFILLEHHQSFAEVMSSHRDARRRPRARMDRRRRTVRTNVPGTPRTGPGRTGVDSNQTRITAYFSPLSSPRHQTRSVSNRRRDSTPPPQQLRSLWIPDIQTEFLAWKMCYNTEMVIETLRLNDITKQNEQCVISMIRFLAMQFAECRSVEESVQVIECVREHRLYAQAEDCMRRCMSELLHDDGVRCRWVVLVVLILLLAASVEQVEDLVLLLLRSSCPLSSRDLMNLLWALTTLLRAMRDNDIDISSRFHYNVRYVLHHMENAAPAEDCSGRSLPVKKQQLQMTREQQRVIDHNLKPNHVVKVIAFAGTGKTTMLVRFAQVRPHLKLLYLTFNKPIAEKAKLRFPPNVECGTIHSMAHKAVGRSYQTQRKRLDIFSLTRVLPERRNSFTDAKVVHQTITSFFCSNDAHISTKHVPCSYRNTNGWIQTFTSQQKKEFVILAEEVWDKMKNPDNNACYITHDGYLKLWQLQKPVLHDYDIIMIDEAQDCSPVMLDILLKQNCGKILVGDPHQQIYSFRGAVNALHTIQHTHLYSLTQSFRFGPEIAYTATAVLEVCKKEKESLIGGRQESSVCGESEIVSSVNAGSRSLSGEITVLCRRNITVFSIAAQLISKNPNCKISFIGGPDKIGLNDIEDMYKLKFGGFHDRSEIRHPLMKHFKRDGYEALSNYITESEDKDLEYKRCVVEKYSMSIPLLVRKIRSSTTSINKADFILGTVHKSKGLEFNTVIIADDFTRAPSATNPPETIEDDEWNLLYMAVTRVKRSVILNRTLIDILKMKGSYCLWTEIRDGVVTCSSSRCRNLVSGVVMSRHPFTYVKTSTERTALTWQHVKDGWFCLPCVKRQVGVFAALLSSHTPAQ